MAIIICKQSTCDGVLHSEYLEDGNGPVQFDTESGAVNWLNQAGEIPEEWQIRHSVGICKRCGSPLYPSDLPEYAFQCFSCDEDFFRFEQENSITVDAALEQRILALCKAKELRCKVDAEEIISLCSTGESPVKSYGIVPWFTLDLKNHWIFVYLVLPNEHDRIRVRFKRYSTNEEMLSAMESGKALTLGAFEWDNFGKCARAWLRHTFPAGTRIVLNTAFEDPQPLPAGATGTVNLVDDRGQLLMKWDSGRSLALVFGLDDFSILQEKEGS